MNICPICQKEHDGSYGSGKFCSKHCQHVYVGKQTKRHVCNLPRTQKPWGTWKCKHCEQIFETKKLMLEHIKAEHSRKDGHAWNYGLTKETSKLVAKSAATLNQNYQNGKIKPSFKGRHHSDETKAKLSKIRKDYLSEHPDKVPYLLNHSSSISYPEQYFIDLFKNENIDLKYHEQIGKYQLDFANKDQRKYLEIDGEQHYVDKKIVKSDQERNQYFKELEWNGMRIRWSDYQKLDNKARKEVIEKIKNFLS